MTTSTLLLDSNVWSHLVLSELPMREKVVAQLAALHSKYPDAAIATSAMCVAECLVAARRLPDTADASRFEAVFKARFNQPGVFVVPVTEQVLDHAATLRANRLKLAASRGSQTAGVKGGKLLLPDATIAASCLVFNPPAVFVTENDGDFHYLEDGVKKTVADLVLEKVG